MPLASPLPFDAPFKVLTDIRRHFGRIEALDLLAACFNVARHRDKMPVTIELQLSVRRERFEIVLHRCLSEEMQPLAADRPLAVGVICFAVRLDGFGGILPVLANAAIYVDTRDIVIPRQGECDRVCAMCFGISKRGLKVCPCIWI